jgi:hypothetical protein
MTSLHEGIAGSTQFPKGGFERTSNANAWMRSTFHLGATTGELAHFAPSHLRRRASAAEPGSDLRAHLPRRCARRVICKLNMLAPRDHGRVVLLPTLILAFALVGCGALELELELPRRRSSQSQGLSWALAIEVSHRLFSRLASRLIHPCAPMPADQMGSTTGWIPLGSSTYPVHPVHGAKPLAHVRLATALVYALVRLVPYILTHPAWGRHVAARVASRFLLSGRRAA